MNDPETFISELELPALPAEYDNLSTRSGFQSGDATAEDEQAFISNKSLVSFASGIKPLYRGDVLDSTLLASMAAEKKFPNNSNPKEWYNYYVKVLTSIGWTSDRNENKTYENRAAEFDVNQAVVEIMTAIAGGPGVQALLIGKTLKALKNLADEDGKIRLFESRAKQLNTSNFQVGLATQTNGAVSLNVSNFALRPRKAAERYCSSAGAATGRR